MASSYATTTAVLPPKTSTGPIGWMKRNLFATPFDTVLTILVVLFLAWVLPPLLRWAVFDATFTGETKEACTFDAACWTVVKVRFGQFIYGLYPIQDRWRVDLAAVVAVLSVVPLFFPWIKQKLLYGAGVLLVVPFICNMILTGGWGGLELVDSNRWGGLFLTLVIAIVGISASLPIGIFLALGRRSDMPIIRSLCVVLIEIVRGVPLITVLFMASVMLPLFFPPGWSVEKLTRALIGVSIFSGAYMAEVIRGGLQAIPKGQYEAGKAMGLNYWQSMGLVILPQCLRMVIPGIVNTFIGLFKDTSLVLIMGLFDLLGIARMIVASPEWLGKSIETYVAAGFGFWIFCFAMSRYSQHLEKKLQTGHEH